MNVLIKNYNQKMEQRKRAVMLHSIIAQQVNAHHGHDCCDRVIGSMSSGEIEVITHADGKEIRVRAIKSNGQWHKI